MADNTILPPGAGGDLVRDIDKGGIKTQVMVLDLGGAGAESLLTGSMPVTGTFYQATQPVSIAASVPVTGAFFQATQPVSLAAALPAGSNTIGAVAPLPNVSVGPTAFTASDAVVAAPVGDGTLVTGASTAGSIVSLVIPSGFTAWTALVKNWTNGSIYSEASFNSTNGTDGDWVEVKGRRTGTAPGIESVVYAFVANGYYRGNGAGFTYYRLRFIGASTFPTVQVTLTEAQGATFLNSGIPAGSSVIGKVSIDQATPGTTNAVSVTNASLAVTGAFYQATQPVSFTWSGLTDAQLRATAVPVSGTFFQATQPVSIASWTGLTDTQLRASAVPVSLASTTITGTVAATQSGAWTTGRTWALSSGTDSVAVAGTVAVSGPLTDAQLRAAVVPVSLASTTVTGSVAVTGPLTDTQLRATAVPVSGTVTVAASANTLGAVKVTDGTYTGAVSAIGEMQAGGRGIDGIVLLLTQLLIESKKQTLILSGATNTWFNDDEIDLSQMVQ